MPHNFDFRQNAVGKQLFLQLYVLSRSWLSGAWPIIILEKKKRAVQVRAVWVGAVRVGGQFFSRIFSSPDPLFVFSYFRGLSWNCGVLCAFSAMKVSSQHTCARTHTHAQTPWHRHRTNIDIHVHERSCCMCTHVCICAYTRKTTYTYVHPNGRRYVHATQMYSTKTQ